MRKRRHFGNGSPPKKVTKSFTRKSSQEKDSTTSANKRQNTITGRNIKLFANLEKVIEETGMQDNTKLLYFVKNVEDYMHISDLIVTKPGGLTVTESLACSLPMAIYSAFPGQERDNAEFLLNKGAAIMLRKKTGADDIVNLVKDKEKLDEMKEKCRELHRPDSAEKIFRLAQKLCNDSKGGNDK